MAQQVLLSVCLFGAVMLLMGMWVGYRLGHQRGLATWRKDYLRMTAADLAVHRDIIAQMTAMERAKA